MGREKGAVYEYFILGPDFARCKKCNFSCKGVRSYSMKTHLQSCNPDAYKKVQEKDGRLKLTSTPLASPATPTFSFDRKKLSADIEQQQERNYAVLAAKPQLSSNVLTSSDFLNLVVNYNKGYPLPRSNHGASNILDRQSTKIKNLLKSEIQNRASGIAATADIWSDTAVSSYVGVTVHFQKAILELQKQSITSSTCYGLIQGLIEYTSKRYADNILNTLASTMKTELSKRFGKFVNIHDDHFDAHFVLATVLDPQQAICLRKSFSISTLVDFLTQRLPASTSQNSNAANSLPQDISSLSFRERELLTVQCSLFG